jgi:hypothetical protein
MGAIKKGRRANREKRTAYRDAKNPKIVAKDARVIESNKD